MLDRPVGAGAGQMSLPSAGAALEDEVVAPGHERRAEAGAEEGGAELRLDGEVELLDGVQLWEACLAHAALDVGLGSMRVSARCAISSRARVKRNSWKDHASRSARPMSSGRGAPGVGQA